MANVDLNLMVIFDAIMQEQSITAAADRLAMTQPSVSNAVSRMRYAWNDPLFVKQGRGIRPTPYAVRLWNDIGQPLESIRLASSQQAFAPANLERTFRIAATDWMADLFWLPLKERIQAEAPNVNIHAVPYNVNGEALLLNADVDLVLDYFEGNSSKVHTQHLFDNHFVCAMRAEHPLANQTLDLHNFSNAEHLLLSLSGEASGGVDKKLEKSGHTRRIAMTVNHCYNIPTLLANTDMITTIPLPIIFKAVNSGQLVIKALPFSMAPGPISMTWHTRLHRDQATQWLRAKILDVLDQRLPKSLRVNPFG
ncbi:LysR family transcriptional regulator [Vibrio sp. 10N.261.55.A7]|uniref:LysR family transcriptional regulator n=1 Tax=Vibrio sp. 10N.261.55.A7 TaxID=1880851 RepID=UPI000C853F76|nr:LysR family transcriptional regulator [Vibrio sp. 10N.261.55.A7]PMJ99286.1 transcriptional regulator [Vibrio sp. 10N.261.55.A7]